MEQINVLVTKKANLTFWTAYYVDPITGKQKSKSTKATNRRDAEKFAGKWEAELRSGKYKSPSKLTWDEFTDRFLLEHCSGLATATEEKYDVAFKQFQTHTNIQFLRDANSELVSEFCVRIRETGVAETTLACRLRHLKGAFNWAVDMGLLAEAPRVKMPKRARGQKMMKGRPITLEEFERMIAKVPEVVGKEAAPSWERLLWGYWYSGLRLEEALNLYWNGSQGIVLMLDASPPLLVIPADHEKGNRDRLHPITPDFAKFLQETPQEERKGRVFKLQRKSGGNSLVTSSDTVSHRISKIGQLARVKVNDENGKVKFASAHDLRRSFGERWSNHVMPAVLQALMRHENINTTMRYYVGQDAKGIAEKLWAVADRLDSSLDTEQTAEASTEDKSTEVDK